MADSLSIVYKTNRLLRSEGQIRIVSLVPRTYSWLRKRQCH